MNDASSSTAGKRREWKKLVWDRCAGSMRRCEPSKATFSVPRRKPTDDLGRSPDFEGAAEDAASRFAFPGVAEWHVKQRPLLQWRDRAGFAPASLLGP